MKMHPEDFDTIKTAINQELTQRGANLTIMYEHGFFARADRVKDLNKRFRWDLLQMSVTNNFVLSLYKYLNDDHIDTALRRIVPELTQRF